MDVRWPMFFFWWIISLSIFYCWRKIEEYLSLEVWVFFAKSSLELHLFNSSFFFLCAMFSNVSWICSVLCKRWQHVELLKQQIHFYKVYLRFFDSFDSPLIFQLQTSADHAEVWAQIFQNQLSFSTRFTFETKSMTPNLLHFWHK